MSQDKNKEIEFFDRFVETNTEYNVLAESGYQRILSEFRKLSAARLPARPKIVDLGCGTGAVTDRLSRVIPGDICGIDINAKEISVAQKKFPHLQFRVGDVEKIDFPDNTFDLVCCSGLIHHFKDPHLCLKEAYRILKPGGCLVSFDPNLSSPFMWTFRYPKSPLYNSHGVTPNESPVSRSQMAGRLAKAGFKNFKGHGLGGISIQYVETPWARPFIALYNAFDSLLGMTPLARSFGAFLICYAEKE